MSYDLMAELKSKNTILDKHLSYWGAKDDRAI